MLDLAPNVLVVSKIIKKCKIMFTDLFLLYYFFMAFISLLHGICMLGVNKKPMPIQYIFQPRSIICN